MNTFFNNEVLSSIDRPQYKSSCSIASIDATFRYLWPDKFAQKNQLDLAKLLGFTKQNLDRGMGLGNKTIAEWIHICADKLGVKLKSQILFEGGWKYDTNYNQSYWSVVKRKCFI